MNARSGSWQLGRHLGRHLGARPAIRAALALIAALQAAAAPTNALAAVQAPGYRDGRIRIVQYSADRVYRLVGHVGYQIDLQFEPGERFVGLGAGDIEALSFVAQANHLFLKPKASPVETNLTVLTDRRHYQFDYTASAQPPDPLLLQDVIYALRFEYPARSDAAQAERARLEESLARAAAQREKNFDYWYCGDAALKPLSAYDDGVHTHLGFGARAELPALFVRNEDGSESLLNFSIERGEILVHRLARQFLVRRGRLAGCIVNAAYAGAGERLDSGTIAPDVVRSTREPGP